MTDRSATPITPDAWSAAKRDLRDLREAYRRLAPIAPAPAAAVSAEIFARLADALDAGMTAQMACDALFDLPPAMIDAALRDADQGAHGPLPDLVARAAPRLHDIRRAPPGISAVSTDTARALVARGLPRAALAETHVTEVWLTRGGDLAREVFRARHPRKDPVLDYWEMRGMVLPRAPLCAEGVGMVARAVRGLRRDRVTNAMTASLRNTVCDLRLILAFVVSGPDLPREFHGPSAPALRTLPRDTAKRLAQLLAPGASAHDEIARRRRLSRGPDIDTAITMDKAQARAALDMLACA